MPGGKTTWDLLLMCLGKSHVFTFKGTVIYSIKLFFVTSVRHLKSAAGQKGLSWEDLKEKESRCREPHSSCERKAFGNTITKWSVSALDVVIFHSGWPSRAWCKGCQTFQNYAQPRMQTHRQTVSHQLQLHVHYRALLLEPLPCHPPPSYLNTPSFSQQTPTHSHSWRRKGHYFTTDLTRHPLTLE